MEQYINKADVIAELNRLIAELVEEGEDTMFEQGRISAFEDVKVFINHTLEVKEVDSTDAFIEKAWDWIEDNILSSNQQNKSRLYFKQFKNSLKGE